MMVVVLNTKDVAAAMVPVGDGVMGAFVDIKGAAATAMVGDGAMVNEVMVKMLVGDGVAPDLLTMGVMVEMLVGDGVAPDLPTMGHPSSLRSHTMPL